MHPTARIFSARVHTPLIRFLGKRDWPSGSETPHVHPAAPTELRNKNFSDFSTASSSSQSPNSSSLSSPSSTSKAFKEFWEAPQRLCSPKVRELEEWEIDAVLSGGASLR
ncbi:hypothetical protein E1B28_008949 [Marasmius oreades]|uniref:Uncharacterized protein n=1 Tax=Marasmius oreades TaxID=181124 RepID=A0A9P7RZF2_9AGAR|nr:uncharacterized protein E1B28_008949 [Marasmius oreades]KAG7092606.1 hypothetical protein E1B28_008949 [Marasmius oreades]